MDITSQFKSALQNKKPTGIMAAVSQIPQTGKSYGQLNLDPIIYAHPQHDSSQTKNLVSTPSSKSGED